MNFHNFTFILITKYKNTVESYRYFILDRDIELIVFNGSTWYYYSIVYSIVGIHYRYI